MSNSEITFDEGVFVFETVMRVRTTEVNMAQHLTLASLTVLIAEAQERFLYSKGIKEVVSDYQDFCVDHSSLDYSSRVRAREELLFEVGVSEVTEDAGNIVFKVTRMYDGSLVAKARQHFILYDSRTEKPAKIAEIIRESLKPQPFEL